MAGRALLLILLVFPVIATVCCQENPVVHTVQGPVEGRVENVSGKLVKVFWGIPYAEKPLGPLRFKKPVPIKSWTTTLKATVQPNACFQANIGAYTDAFEGISMWYPQTTLSEDCLYLNVWSPAHARKLPVVVWIHGGSFAAGSSTTSLYNGKYLSTINDVIVVSINYRLGALGFLYLGIDDTPGNMGLLDQQLALKWVQANINEFGGDKNRVTIFGSSAGGASIAYHLLMPTSWPLFNNGMMQGGSSLAHWASKSTKTTIVQSKKIAGLSGCDENESTEAIYNCLMSVDPQDLSNHQWTSVEYYNAVPIGPIVDGDLIPASPLDLARTGRFKNTSLVTGFNTDEGMMLLQIEEINHRSAIKEKKFLNIAREILLPMGGEVVPSTINEYASFYRNRNESYVDILDNMLGDLVIKCPVLDFATYYANAGNDVYVYLYDHMSSGNPWPEWMGILHGYEIDHFFGQPFNMSKNYSEVERTLSSEMMNAFCNLAKSGNPNIRGDGSHEKTFRWPRFTEAGERYLFKTVDDTHTSPDMPYQKCAYWRGVLTQINHEPEYAVCGTKGLFHAMETLSIIMVVVVGLLIYYDT